MTADAANFKEYVPLLLFTCPPPFRGVGGEHSESEGGGYMGRSAARVPIVQRLWWRLTPQILKSAVLSTILLARPHARERK